MIGLVKSNKIKELEMKSIDIVINDIKTELKLTKEALLNEAGIDVGYALEGEIIGLEKALEVVEKHKREGFLEDGSVSNYRLVKVDMTGLIK